MGSRRVLVLVGLIIIAIAIAIGVFFLIPRPSTEEEPEVEEPQTVDILIAANNLTRGMAINEERIQLQSWPVDRLPGAYYTDPSNVLGYIVRVDIPQGMPLMPSMLSRSPAAVGAVGSEAALTIPPGKRAYAIPMDFLGAVAWTIEPGDHVDVLVSWTISQLDEEFQSVLPNQYICIGGEEPCQGIYGRMEVLPTGHAIMVYPTDAAESRYVAQMTIQDVVVLGVGKFEEQPAEGETVRPAEEGQQPVEGEAQPTPPPVTQAVILIVDPQDALVLKALMELQADVDLVLRGAGDTDIVTTDPVSMEYIITRYGIAIPPKLPYGVGPVTPSQLEQEVEAGVEAVSRPAE
ncbi:MAG TPA: Flp pilus assembly protein CpaB [Anaerolineales bacterium]|nr:Flp pilus assembly protein CpaB [Anaerolineales bacterium]